MLSQCVILDWMPVFWRQKSPVFTQMSIRFYYYLRCRLTSRTTICVHLFYLDRLYKSLSVSLAVQELQRRHLHSFVLLGLSVTTACLKAPLLNWCCGKIKSYCSKPKTKNVTEIIRRWRHRGTICVHSNIRHGKTSPLTKLIFSHPFQCT